MPKHLNSADDFEMVPIGRLKVHPKNVNEADLGAIIESIKAQGFYGALVAQRGTNFVCVGNHRLLAARQLGFDTLPVTWIDCDDETALRVMIADNRTTRLGNDNPAALAELLAELAATETGLGPGLGYDGDDLDQLLSDLSRTGIIDRVNGTDDDWVGMPEFAPSSDNIQIVINFENEKDRDEYVLAQEIKFNKKVGKTWTTWHPFHRRQDLVSLRYE